MESITTKELAYKVSKTLIISYSMLKEFITDRDKLFILVYWKTLIVILSTRVKLLSSYHLETNR
jgi:hypothetical protein